MGGGIQRGFWWIPLFEINKKFVGKEREASKEESGGFFIKVWKEIGRRGWGLHPEMLPLPFLSLLNEI